MPLVWSYYAPDLISKMNQLSYIVPSVDNYSSVRLVFSLSLLLPLSTLLPLLLTMESRIF